MQIRKEEEDVLHSSKLKNELTYVRVLRTLLEQMVSAADIKSVMDAVLGALQELIPFHTISYLISNKHKADTPSVVYIFAKKPISSSYASHVQKSIQEFLNKNIDKTVSKKKSQHKFYHEVLPGSAGIDEKSDTQPKSSFCLPFSTDGGENFGVFHIASSTQRSAYTKNQRAYAEDIVRVAATNFQKIQSLIEEREKEIKKFKMAVDAATDGIIMANADQHVTYYNATMEMMAGYSSLEMQGSDVSSMLVHEDTTEEVFSNMQNTLKSRKPFTTEDVKLRKKDGTELDVQLSIYPVIEREKVQFFVGLLQDIQGRKTVDKMKTEFVSIASHQLRTPMTSINWNIEMLLDGDLGKLSDPQSESLDEIHASSQRMVRLINDLLNVSRLETGRLTIEPEPTSLATLIEAVIEDQEPISNAKNCHIRFSKPKRAKKINIDQTLIRQVVANLISNAVKYSNSENGNVYDIHVSLVTNGDFVECKVQDAGVGIPEAQQDRIFQKFFRADNAVSQAAEGSGLGLYVAKMIVEASGGTIGFTSSKSKGTTFYFTLPIAGSKARKGEKKFEQDS